MYKKYDTYIYILRFEFVHVDMFQDSVSARSVRKEKRSTDYYFEFYMDKNGR